MSAQNPFFAPLLEALDAPRLDFSAVQELFRSLPSLEVRLEAMAAMAHSTEEGSAHGRYLKLEALDRLRREEYFESLRGADPLQHARLSRVLEGARDVFGETTIF